MTNTLVFDVETTTFCKGNPYSQQNKLVCISYKWNEEKTKCFYVDDNGSIGAFSLFNDLIDKADLVIGFNLKFDLSWIRRYGINISNTKLWDCQLHHFLHTNQLETYPSLDGVSSYYQLGRKLDVVASDYWSKGIDTCDIPREVLTEYAIHDVDLTYAVYQCQKDNFDSHQQRVLFSLQCQDLLVLQEMEWNGLSFDTTTAIKDAEINAEIINDLEEKLFYAFHCNGLDINLSSRDHLSTLLYGGTITFEDRIPIGTYKTGAKIGQVRYKVMSREVPFSRIIEPLKGSEMAKAGYWATDVVTFKKLKTNKTTKVILEMLEKRSGLMKLNGTYLMGLSSLITEKDWKKDTLHGQFNQVTVVTGRLSSTSPNLQNIPSEAKRYIRSCL